MAYFAPPLGPPLHACAEPDSCMVPAGRGARAYTAEHAHGTAGGGGGFNDITRGGRGRLAVRVRARGPGCPPPHPPPATLYVPPVLGPATGLA
jgi:hypothetical protein